MQGVLLIVSYTQVLSVKELQIQSVVYYIFKALGWNKKALERSMFTNNLRLIQINLLENCKRSHYNVVPYKTIHD